MIGMMITIALFVFFTDPTLGALKCTKGLQKCQWESWSKWSSCSKDCGEGTRVRSRSLCCNEDDSFDKCLKDCGVADNSLETERCGNVCPAGNCTFKEITDTGIEATDYVTMMDGDIILNPPVTLKSDKDFCKRSCLDTNLQRGLHCWTYSFSPPQRCKLYFFNKPLELLYTNKTGGSPGSSIYVRHCTGTTECKATSADVIFIVDSSGSIGYENFKKIKIFLQSMVNRLDVDKDLTRVGLMTFNDHVNWQFKLDQFDAKMDVLKAVEKIPYIIGSTQTSEALETLRKEGFDSSRTGVPKIAVVVTDGLSRNPGLTKVRAALIRQMGIQMYAIGIGNNTDHTELFNIASMPEDKYLFEFPDFDNLDNVTLDVNYVKCKGTTDQTNTTSNGTTPIPISNNCTDTIDNCDSYGRDMCTDFGDWAHAHCSLYCGFCKGPPTTEGLCRDNIPNCASFGTYVCQSKDYIAWVNSNCRKFCGVCGSGVTTRPTTPTTTTAKLCADTIDNCAGYAYACNDPKFRGFLEARCPAYCGYCKSYELIKGKVVNGVRCPDWNLPTECTLRTVSPDCCPLPNCPAGYIVTAEKNSTTHY